MNFKIATIVLIMGLGQLTNASFFGLFGSSKPSRKPDVIVSESPKSETDRIAYENYLSSLASTYYPSPPSTPIRYMPVYSYQPEWYPNYIKPSQNVMYHSVRTPRILKTTTIPLQYNYQPIATRVELPRVKLERPITVLPSSPYDESSIIRSASEGKTDFNKLIEGSSSTTAQPGSSSRVKSHVFEIPEPQISASLYDLPVLGISPDFHTGGYLTKMMTVSPSDNDNSWSDQKFGHIYDNKDGTKVSEEGHLLVNENGEETVIKRGQYEYVDANGKTVLVKWVADDDGFRLVD